MTLDISSVLIIGANRGLGLATARAAAARGAHVVCAGRDVAAVQAVADQVGGEAVIMDLSSLDSVHAAAATLPHVDAVACNAGVQFVHAPTCTQDGFEQTFQVNHLAHLMLVDVLLARPDPPQRIAFVGSGTHDPAIRTGTPDPLEGDIYSMARADDLGDDDARTAGLRRYTTSKMLAIATAGALARERPDLHISAFDPGMMPGTGLARDFPAPFRLLWNTGLKALRILPFASSPRASGRAFATLLTATPPPAPSGTYLDYHLTAINPSPRATDPAFQDAAVRDSRNLIGTTKP